MTRIVLTSGLLLCSVVGATLAARGWSLFAVGVAMLHVSGPTVVAAYVLRGHATSSTIVQLALGGGTGLAPAATVLWTSILLGGGPSGGSALWISYIISAVASAVLITVYSTACGWIAGDDVTPMMKGFVAAAAPIPAVSTLVLLLPEIGVRTAVLVLAIGLPVGLLAYDCLGPFTQDPNDFDDTAELEGLTIQLVTKATATFVCSIAAGMGLMYMFNDPARGAGAGLALSGGLGFCALGIALGPIWEHAATGRRDDTPASAKTTQGDDVPKEWIRGGLVAGGILLVLLSFAVSGSS